MLGRSRLSPRCKLKLRARYEKNYCSDTFAVATGAVDHEKLVSSLENFIKKGKGKHAKDRSKPEHFPGRKYIVRDTGQVQLAISTPGNPYGVDAAATQTIISSYLGVGASSLLFQEVREKRGLVYNIYTYNQNLRDVGAFSVFAGTSKKNLEEVAEIILYELENMKKGIDQVTLETVKHKTIGLFILGLESNRQRMHNLGLSTLRTGNPMSVEEVVARIEAVTVDDVQRVTEKMFDSNKIALTAYGVSDKEADDLDALIL